MAKTSDLDVEATFKIDGLGKDLHVIAFEGEESVSELFQFSIVVGCKSSDVEFSKVIGKNAQLTLKSKYKRYFHGIINRFVQREKGRHYTVYHASLVPRCWTLFHRHDCRIFQKESIKTIITEKLLKKAGVTNKFRSKGGTDPKKREYCVQYRESVWDYISRLLEEEGYFYYFEHGDNKHVLQMGNDFTFHPDIEKDPDETDADAKITVGYHGADAAPGKEFISQLQYAEEIRTGAVTLNDYNYEKPKLDFKSPKKAKKFTELEDYDYPGLFLLPEQGKELAQLRVDEYQAMRKILEGQSDSIRFTAGYCFRLDLSDREKLNKKKYMLTQVCHFGEKHDDLEAGLISRRIRYHNTFRCIQRDRPFRPPRLTPKPSVLGCQTALVVGPKDEEIYTDKGRIKVQFHWDRKGQKNENSSCWVRVAQTMAGQSYGSLWIPRIGHEVVVDFLEGDPDRPLVIGSVYHAQNPPAFTSGDDKTKTSFKSNSSIGGGGHNELTFDDKKNKEQIYVHAQRDKTVKVRRNSTVNIGGNETVTIKGTQKVTVTDDCTLTVEDGMRRVDVKKGNYEIGVDEAHLMLDAEEDLVLGAKYIDGTGREKIDLTCGASKIKMTKLFIKLENGPSKIEMTKAGIKINGPVVKINCP